MIKLSLFEIDKFLFGNEENTDCYLNNPFFSKICEILKNGVDEQQLLECFKQICILNDDLRKQIVERILKSSSNTTNDQQPNKAVQRILGSKFRLATTIEIEEGKLPNNPDKWSNEIVYTVYCNDNLEELPLAIVEQMKDYMQEVIDKKHKDVKLDGKVNNEGHLPK